MSLHGDELTLLQLNPEAVLYLLIVGIGMLGVGFTLYREGAFHDAYEYWRGLFREPEYQDGPQDDREEILQPENRYPSTPGPHGFKHAERTEREKLNIYAAYGQPKDQDGPRSAA